MKIKFKHTFGSQEKGWLQVTTISADVEAHEEKEALEGGWLRDAFEWYQTRSTRIRCRDFVPARKWPKGYEFTVGNYSDFPQEELQRVYAAYILNCGYTDYCSPLEHDLVTSKFGVVRKDGVIVAFTKFHLYNGGIESIMFCWDYSEPKVSLGIAIQAKEVEYATSLGFDDLYLGPGYERGSVYKSRFPGFEWWTGTEWSLDTAAFVSLCERDTQVRADVDMSVLEKLFDSN